MKIIEKSKKGTVDFSTLKVGDCFKDDDGDLMMKLDEKQKAVGLSNGYVYDDMCSDAVTPVNAEVQIID